MKKESDIRKVLVTIKVIDAAAIEAARATNEAMNLVSLGEQELGKIGAVLAGDSRDQRFFQALFLPG